MPTFREDVKIGAKVPIMKTDDYNDQSVTKEKIRDGNITSEKLADGAVSTDKLPDGAVSTSKIASRSVTNEKIAYNSVSIAELTPEVRMSIDKKADAEQVNSSLYNLEKKIGDRFVVEGDVTNLPDEEDLTSVKESERDVLKLADRSYAPRNFIGKGYKILRKNIKPVSLAVTKIVVSSAPTSDGYISFIINGVESHVDVVTSSDTTTDKVADKIVLKLTETMTEYEVSKDASTITLTRKFGGEVSTASSFSAVNTGTSCSITDSTKKELRNIITPIMMNQPNTIYEIRYDFDIMGEEIKLPDGVSLYYNGGSIKNGTIYLSNTIFLGKYDFDYSNPFVGTAYNSNNEKINLIVGHPYKGVELGATLLLSGGVGGEYVKPITNLEIACKRLGVTKFVLQDWKPIDGSTTSWTDRNRFDKFFEDKQGNYKDFNEFCLYLKKTNVTISSFKMTALLAYVHEFTDEQINSISESIFQFFSKLKEAMDANNLTWLEDVVLLNEEKISYINPSVCSLLTKITEKLHTLNVKTSIELDYSGDFLLCSKYTSKLLTAIDNIHFNYYSDRDEYDEETGEFPKLLASAFLSNNRTVEIREFGYNGSGNATNNEYKAFKTMFKISTKTGIKTIYFWNSWYKISYTNELLNVLKTYY